MVVRTTDDDGVNRHPLDYDALAKGDVLSIKDQERILGVKHTHEKFWSRALGLKIRIEKSLAERGLFVTMKNDHDNLVVCTDPDASKYNARQVVSGLRKAVRSHRRNTMVDRSNLSADERKVHDRNLVVDGHSLATMLTQRKRLRITTDDGSERKTPLLPDSTKEIREDDEFIE